MQSKIAINWLLSICDSRELPRQLIVAGMIEKYENEAKVANRKFDGNSGNVY